MAISKKDLEKEFRDFGVIESIRFRSVARGETTMPRRAAAISGISLSSSTVDPKSRCLLWLHTRHCRRNSPSEECVYRLRGEGRSTWCAETQW